MRQLQYAYYLINLTAEIFLNKDQPSNIKRRIWIKKIRLKNSNCWKNKNQLANWTMKFYRLFSYQNKRLY